MQVEHPQSTAPVLYNDLADTPLFRLSGSEGISWSHDNLITSRVHHATISQNSVQFVMEENFLFFSVFPSRVMWSLPSYSDRVSHAAVVPHLSTAAGESWLIAAMCGATLVVRHVQLHGTEGACVLSEATTALGDIGVCLVGAGEGRILIVTAQGTVMVVSCSLHSDDVPLRLHTSSASTKTWTQRWIYSGANSTKFTGTPCAAFDQERNLALVVLHSKLSLFHLSSEGHLTACGQHGLPPDVVSIHPHPHYLAIAVTRQGVREYFVSSSWRTSAWGSSFQISLSHRQTLSPELNTCVISKAALLHDTFVMYDASKSRLIVTATVIPFYMGIPEARDVQTSLMLSSSAVCDISTVGSQLVALCAQGIAARVLRVSASEVFVAELLRSLSNGTRAISCLGVDAVATLLVRAYIADRSSTAARRREVLAECGSTMCQPWINSTSAAGTVSLSTLAVSYSRCVVEARNAFQQHWNQCIAAGGTDPHSAAHTTMLRFAEDFACLSKGGEQLFRALGCLEVANALLLSEKRVASVSTEAIHVQAALRDSSEREAWGVQAIVLRHRLVLVDLCGRIAAVAAALLLRNGWGRRTRHSTNSGLLLFPPLPTIVFASADREQCQQVHNQLSLSLLDVLGDDAVLLQSHEIALFESLSPAAQTECRARQLVHQLREQQQQEAQSTPGALLQSLLQFLLDEVLRPWTVEGGATVTNHLVLSLQRMLLLFEAAFPEGANGLFGLVTLECIIRSSNDADRLQFFTMFLAFLDSLQPSDWSRHTRPFVEQSQHHRLPAAVIESLDSWVIARAGHEGDAFDAALLLYQVVVLVPQWPPANATASQLHLGYRSLLASLASSFLEESRVLEVQNYAASRLGELAKTSEPLHIDARLKCMALAQTSEEDPWTVQLAQLQRELWHQSSCRMASADEESFRTTLVREDEFFRVAGTVPPQGYLFQLELLALLGNPVPQIVENVVRATLSTPESTADLTAACSSLLRTFYHRFDEGLFPLGAVLEALITDQNAAAKGIAVRLATVTADLVACGTPCVDIINALLELFDDALERLESTVVGFGVAEVLRQLAIVVDTVVDPSHRRAYLGQVGVRLQALQLSAQRGRLTLSLAEHDTLRTVEEAIANAQSREASQLLRSSTVAFS